MYVLSMGLKPHGDRDLDVQKPPNHFQGSALIKKVYRLLFRGTCWAVVPGANDNAVFVSCLLWFEEHADPPFPSSRVLKQLPHERNLLFGLKLQINNRWSALIST